RAAGGRRFRDCARRINGLRPARRRPRPRRRPRNRCRRHHRPAGRCSRSRDICRGHGGRDPTARRSGGAGPPRRPLLGGPVRRRASRDDHGGHRPDAGMLRRYNRLLVAIFVVADFLSACIAFALAYLIRFNTGLLALDQPPPPFTRYLLIAPFIGLLVVAAFQVQGLYRLRRGRTRVDDFFGVLVGSLLGTLLGVLGTLYLQTYHLSDTLKAQGYLEVSRGVWGLFLVLTVLATYASRETVRDLLRRRWRAGVGLKHVVVAGVGDLGRMVADRILEHSELGFRIVGFVDDRAGSGDAIGYRGLPL